MNTMKTMMFGLLVSTLLLMVPQGAGSFESAEIRAEARVLKEDYHGQEGEPYSPEMTTPLILPVTMNSEEYTFAEHGFQSIILPYELTFELMKYKKDFYPKDDSYSWEVKDLVSGVEDLVTTYMPKHLLKGRKITCSKQSYVREHDPNNKPNTAPMVHYDFENLDEFAVRKWNELENIEQIHEWINVWFPINDECILNNGLGFLQEKHRTHGRGVAVNTDPKFNIVVAQEGGIDPDAHFVYDLTQRFGKAWIFRSAGSEPLPMHASLTIHDAPDMIRRSMEMRCALHDYKPEIKRSFSKELNRLAERYEASELSLHSPTVAGER